VRTGAGTYPDRKRLLITGGLGFVGSRVVDSLHPLWEISIVDWDTASPENERMAKRGILVIHADIAEKRTWNRLGPCDYILHAAGQISAEKSREDPQRDFLSNALGTLRVAEYARRTGANVIFCNTIRVYDPDFVDKQVGRGRTVREDAPTIMTSLVEPPPYALSKYLGERYLKYYAESFGFKVISHRMTGIVGPGQKGSPMHGWISYLVDCAVNGREYTIFGDGRQSRDILHIADLAGLVSTELHRFKHFCPGPFAVYNIGGGPRTALSILDVIRILKEDHGLILKYKTGAFRPGEPKHYVSGNGLIRRKGWKPTRLDVHEIIREFVAWHKNRKIESK